MRKTISALALCAVLWGCSTPASVPSTPGGPQAPTTASSVGTSAQTGLVAACGAYATALSSAAAFRAAGALAPAQVALVEQIRPVANTLCEGPLPVDAASATATMQALAAQLAAVLPEVKQ